MTYYEMIKTAVVALKDRTGSSSAAIKSYIVANNKDIAFKQHLLRAALKKGVETGKLVQVKASYKLSAEEKKTTKKKPVAKIPATKKTAVKKAAVKKPVAKKPTTKK